MTQDRKTARHKTARQKDNYMINWGIIGCGNVTEVKSGPAFNKVSGSKLLAVMRRDRALAEDYAKRHNVPKVYSNAMELINDSDITAVYVATPPGSHAEYAIETLKAGKPVYIEKPMALNYAECQKINEASEKYGAPVFVAYYRRALPGFLKVKELIESGKIGEVHQVVAQIHYNPGPQDTTIQPPPASLDWEEWCGPAPKLEYRPSIGHKSWRLEKEYGNGHLVDWGIHHIDIIRKIMGEGMPDDIYATGGIFAMKDQITSPDTLEARFGFKRAPVTWQHRLWGNGDVTREFNNGIFFYGDKGTLFAEDSKIVIFPEGKDTKREDLAIPTPAMQENHVENFLKAVRHKDNKIIDCTPEDAFQSTAAVQLAMISYNTGTIVKWDSRNKQTDGNPEAFALLKRAYRGKYVHP